MAQQEVNEISEIMQVSDGEEIMNKSVSNENPSKNSYINYIGKSLPTHLVDHTYFKRHSLYVMANCDSTQTKQYCDSKTKAAPCCTICDKRFTRLSSLWRHVQIHTVDPLHNCPLCDKKFFQKSNLLRHLMVHYAIKHFTCAYCGHEFAQANNLKQHIQAHLGIQPFECGFCKKTFTQVSNLQRHLDVHYDFKRYTCSICNAGFTTKFNLNRHGTIHRIKKNYLCYRCGKYYVEGKRALKHMEICNNAGSLDRNSNCEVQYC